MPAANSRADAEFIRLARALGLPPGYSIARYHDRGIHRLALKKAITISATIAMKYPITGISVLLVRFQLAS
jgi:hypothetical protein